MLISFVFLRPVKVTTQLQKYWVSWKIDWIIFTGDKIWLNWPPFPLAFFLTDYKKGVTWTILSNLFFLWLKRNCCLFYPTKLLSHGVNITNVLRAAFAPVDLCPTYWRTAQRVQRRSWGIFKFYGLEELGADLLVKLNGPKEWLPAHLRFAPVGWWNWPNGLREIEFGRKFHTKHGLPGPIW